MTIITVNKRKLTVSQREIMDTCQKKRCYIKKMLTIIYYCWCPVFIKSLANKHRYTSQCHKHNLGQKLCFTRSNAAFELLLLDCIAQLDSLWPDRHTFTVKHTPRLQRARRCVCILTRWHRWQVCVSVCVCVCVERGQSRVPRVEHRALGCIWMRTTCLSVQPIL